MASNFVDPPDNIRHDNGYYVYADTDKPIRGRSYEFALQNLLDYFENRPFVDVILSGEVDLDQLYSVGYEDIKLNSTNPTMVVGRDSIRTNFAGNLDP